jgi:hypothetical protein
MVAVLRVTAVFEKIRPFKDEPGLNITDVLTKRMPSKCAPSKTITCPATDQNMFFASAPPLRITLVFAVCLTAIVVWMMKISSEVPLKVRSAVVIIVTVIAIVIIASSKTKTWRKNSKYEPQAP